MKNKPNVLFIVADDLNSWIGALGRHPNAVTPNIDQLARRGFLFSHAYCAAPYCNASRMSVFSGQYPTSTGVFANEPFWEQTPKIPTFLDVFRASGYALYGSGKVFHGSFDYATAGRERTGSAKWRDEQNRTHVWDEFVVNVDEPMPPARPLNKLVDFNHFEQLDPRYHHFDWGVLPSSQVSSMPDAHVVAAARNFLQRSETFFCAAGLYKPHLPWYLPFECFEAHPLDEVCLPFVKSDDLDDVPDIARAWATEPPDHKLVTKGGQWRHAVQAYSAAVTYCDARIGELMEALDNSPNAENTAIVLWGDNGFHLGEKLHWRKFVLWEEATRVPLIIVPPRSARHEAVRVDTPVSLIDLFPTLCDLLGIDKPLMCDGESLMPLVRGDRAERLSPVQSTWLSGNSSFRSGRWRYTQYHNGGEELYDHTVDPYEWNNLIGDGRFSEITARFSQHYKQLASRPSS